MVPAARMNPARMNLSGWRSDKMISAQNAWWQRKFKQP